MWHVRRRAAKGPPCAALPARWRILAGEANGDKRLTYDVLMPGSG